MTSENNPTTIAAAVALLEKWLDSTRCPSGYGGPVAHWWRQSLLYTGPGLDWRYEGIIGGYLNLWEKTGGPHWLEKAQRAGDDLVAGQLADGHFCASAFEINPVSAGTPHEAACDASLLRLAHRLKDAGDPGWQRYADCAARNLQAFYFDQLWDREGKYFRDNPGIPSFVSNKAATACEALFMLAALQAEPSWVERYALPNLDRILAHQVREAGQLDGAIAQNSIGTRRVEKYFPFYMARCIPALVKGYEWSGNRQYLEAAARAAAFIMRYRDEGGGFPQVLYPNGQRNRYPQWIAGSGDILHALQLLEPHGVQLNLEPSLGWLLKGQGPAGGLRTAHGFASQVSQKRPGVLPDFRDLLPVVGWNAMAFRYLTSLLPLAPLPAAESKAHTADCTFRGRRLLYTENQAAIEAMQAGVSQYLWIKGEPWARTAGEAFWLQ